MRTSRILAPEKPPPVHETVAVRNSDRLASVQTRSRTGVIAIRPRPDSIHVEGGGADGPDQRKSKQTRDKQTEPDAQHLVNGALAHGNRIFGWAGLCPAASGSGSCG